MSRLCAAHVISGACNATTAGRDALVTCGLALMVLLAACSNPGAPQTRPSDATASQAVTEAVDRFIDQTLDPGIRNLRALVVTVDGVPLVERYYDSRRGETADVASVTKSVVSTLVGIAEADGLLGLGDTLGQLLPSHTDEMSAEVASITVSELLTMSAGLPDDAQGENPSDPRPAGEDWVAEILQRGTVRPPGAGFAYSSGGSHLLAAILVEVTGRPLLAYAREKLFDPLGIDTRPAFQPLVARGRPDPVRAYQRTRFAWPRDPQGVNVGYGFLKLSAPDQVKLGNLYLQEGVWEGRRIVPESWVRQATGTQVTTGTASHPGYGYQWWVVSAGDHPAYAAIGFGGQIIEVVPDLGLVVVASTWIDDHVVFDSQTWVLLVTLAILPALGS